MLCRELGTRPGSYRAAMRLWLDPSGTVSRADLLSSTGDPVRDRRLHETLVGSGVGTPPPVALPQPVIVVILPRSPQVSGDCS
ncbi:hypothetical protein GCM10011611_10060 [Aliidongia dinghuensis]|uniref:Uncharacterized protein n=2 Tax=Aliidongia dinghuensis TaxID=1867774 RepID=A0A8J3E3G9_9PROT|nr:hypothetical protein GCM10011611_10060 [Aliidongia dinghuensis]